jgi:3-phenylpropionate/cinnamic acid dioxygenase small subunit
MELQLHQRVAELYARHSEIISDDLLEQWPGHHRGLRLLTSRVNFDRKLPLCTILCESRGALLDRVTAIRNTMVFAPRSVIHTVSNARLVETTPDGTLLARSMFCVWQTLVDGQSHLQLVGRSFDRIVVQGDTLQFVERLAIFDSELVPGSIVYPSEKPRRLARRPVQPISPRAPRLAHGRCSRIPN